MKKEQLETTIFWLKRFFAVTTIVVWLIVLIGFLKNPAPFSQLVPYCMGSTMLIFGVLTSIYKGLEYWEEQIQNKK